MRSSLLLLPSVGRRLPHVSLTVLRHLLLAEAATQAARCAEHEALAVRLRGLTDADSGLERELAEAGAARARETMGDVEHALERIEDGTYGWCERCGEPVPFERLEAIPWARLCVACPSRPAPWPQ